MALLQDKKVLSRSDAFYWLSSSVDSISNEGWHFVRIIFRPDNIRKLIYWLTMISNVEGFFSLYLERNIFFFWAQKCGNLLWVFGHYTKLP